MNILKIDTEDSLWDAQLWMVDSIARGSQAVGEFLIWTREGRLSFKLLSLTALGVITLMYTEKAHRLIFELYSCVIKVENVFITQYHKD